MPVLDFVNHADARVAHAARGRFAVGDFRRREAASSGLAPGGLFVRARRLPGG